MTIPSPPFLQLNDDDPAHQALRAVLPTWGLPLSVLEEMPGGASTRRFFRVDRSGQSLVAMYVPSPSQEIHKARQSCGTAPFVEVAGLLDDHEVPVPRLFERDEKHHLLLVEDLGDDTLANYLEANESRRTELYQIAVRELALAQRKLDPLPDASVVKTRAFDHELLRWEIEHFSDWALEARGIQLSPEDRQIFDESAEYLATTIASWPRGFVHRDYQSRNLMVTEKKGALGLCWIDFQDAMMGPRAYDLVALLTDSYQTFSRSFIEDRLKEFCVELQIEDHERLIFEFDLITVQRKLKDAGRFVFIDRVNKNPHFLPYVSSTIEKARSALTRVKGHGPLHRLDALLTRLLSDEGFPR